MIVLVTVENRLRVGLIAAHQNTKNAFNKANFLSNTQFLRNYFLEVEMY